MNNNNTNRLSELKNEEAIYKAQSTHILTNTAPVLIRVKNAGYRVLMNLINDPCDQATMIAMQKTMKQLCIEAQGCVFGYAISNEINLILIGNRKPQWYDYDAQRICSNISSLATAYFSKFFQEATDKALMESNQPSEQLQKSYRMAKNELVRFEAVCFNVPVDRLAHMISLRQMKGRRSALQRICQNKFSRPELVGKCNDEMIDMLQDRFGVDWMLIPNDFKHGAYCKKNTNVKRGGWPVEQCHEFDQFNAKYWQDILMGVCENK